MDVVVLTDVVFSVIGALAGVYVYRTVKFQLWKGLLKFYEWRHPGFETENDSKEIPNEPPSKDQPNEIPISPPNGQPPNEIRGVSVD